jgi:SWI/SNF-related matrix-associated actin-dependent regulator 1 of chromatin subfamily A
MKLHFKNNLFTLQCYVSDNQLPKMAGFTYRVDDRVWVTPFAANALKVSPACVVSEDAKQAFAKAKSRRALSCATSISNPKISEVRGKRLYPYQSAGVEFLLDTPRAFLADEMGLGKTVQAICLCNLVNPKKILIICPASLKINWAREWAAWSTIDADPFIINYDILKKNFERIHSTKWDVLILDECHYLKNKEAKRTQCVVGEKKLGKFVSPPIDAGRVIALSGTPIVNRPIEIFSVLSYLLPHAFTNSFEFAKRYCNAQRNRWGWDFKGASNLEELQTNLRQTVMLRRLKRDVLKDLPSKIRQVIEIDPDTSTRKLLVKEKKFLGAEFLDDLPIHKEKLTEKDFKAIVKRLKGSAESFSHLASTRKAIGLSKLGAAVEHISECLESGKVVVFCYHRALAEALFETFADIAVMVIGKTLQKDRDFAVTSFQADSTKTLFIGNIQAAGVGLTLTAASQVIFLEQDWVPGNVTQAEDRCHRIGTKNSVLIQHLVLAGSLDAYIAKTVIAKQDKIDKAIEIDQEEIIKRMLE